MLKYLRPHSTGSSMNTVTVKQRIFRVSARHLSLPTSSNINELLETHLINHILV